MAYPNCDVCGKNGKGVASSTLGAVSFCYCQECLNQGAEPLSMWQTVIDINDGQISELFRESACSYYEGGYIHWDKIKEVCPIDPTFWEEYEAAMKNP